MKTHQEIVQFELRAIRKLLSMQSRVMLANVELLTGGALAPSITELRESIVEVNKTADAEAGWTKGDQ